jgi:hypothetical protein
MDPRLVRLTLAIEDCLLEAACVVAAEKRTTVNAMVREFLKDIANRDQRQQRARAALCELIHSSKGRMRPDFRFEREETHER